MTKPTNDSLREAVEDVCQRMDRCQNAIGSDGDWRGRMSSLAADLRSALSRSNADRRKLAEVIAEKVRDECISVCDELKKRLNKQACDHEKEHGEDLKSIRLFANEIGARVVLAHIDNIDLTPLIDDAIKEVDGE